MVCPLRIVLVFLSAAIFACGVFRFARFGNEEEEEPEEQDQDQLDGEEDGRRVNQSGATSQDSHDRRRGVLQESENKGSWKSRLSSMAVTLFHFASGKYLYTQLFVNASKGERSTKKVAVKEADKKRE